MNSKGFIKGAICLLAAILVLASAGAWAATIEVSQPTYMTSNQRYDRNPSIINDGTNYWLFYTKGDQAAPAIRGSGGYNPDADNYVVYYKTASTIAGLAGATETKLAFSESARPVGFDQRVVSATYFNSKVYAFVSSGQSGTDKGLYYYEYSGGTWTGPTTLIADATAQGGHVNITSDASYIYIIWESSDGSSDCYTWNGTTLSLKIDISTDNMPRITLMGTTLYVVSIADLDGDIEVYSAAAGASPSFSSHSTAITGVGLYDPCIFNDGTNLYVVSAPYVEANQQQYLIQTKYSSGAWATAKRVTYGGYGTTYWWEYWPMGYWDGTNLYVFYTTESSSPVYGDGEIACLKMSWNLGNDHYCDVQTAINQAAVSGDVINVAAGTYKEQVYITKSLDLIGVGSKPVIKAPTAATRTTRTIPESGRTFDPIIFANGGAVVIDVTVDNFEIDGNNDGGSNTFCGILFRNTDPGTISNNDLHSLRGTGQETQGILMYGANTDVIVSGNTVTDFSRNGITAVVNASAAISGNTVTADGPLPLGNWAQNGIEIGYGASGSITGNTVTGCSIIDPSWAASGILAIQATGTTQINGNTITQNQVNIYLGDCSASIQGNTIYATATGTGQTYCYGIVGDPGETKAPKPSPFGESDNVSKSIRPEDNSNGTKLTYTVACTNNIVESDGSGETGIGIYAGMYGTYDIDFTATGNTVRDWQYGFDLYEYSGSDLISAEIHYNDIKGNGYGLYNETAKNFDATNNWWGNANGPEDALGTTEVPPCGDVADMINAVPSGNLGNAVSENVDYCPWLGGDAGFDTEIYAGCNHPCDDFCLDVKLSGADIRFFHFEYPLPVSGCIDLVSSSRVSGLGIVVWQTIMFGNVLNIDGSFDPDSDFTGSNVKIGSICFRHDGTCPDIVQTLTCTADEVRDGAGNPVDVTPGMAIINVDNTAPTKTHPDDQLPCYRTADELYWPCWDLDFYKGTGEWQCDLLQATIRIYKAAGCNTGDLVFTHDFFTATIPGDFSICYPTNQAERNAIWATLTSDGTYYVRLTVKDNCCNEANNCDAFTFCKDTYTDNYMTCVDAKPAHNHICLEWNYTADPTNAVKLRILRSPYRVGNYPEYAAVNPVPSGYNDASWYQVYEGTDTYPCNGATWFQDNGQGCNGGGTFFANNTRDIYWYAGFTKDAAGNWSAPNMIVATGADRATSYWLGDVADPFVGPPDGRVWGAGDLGKLTSAYGTAPPSDNTVDYGPETQEHGIGRGIPTPDDVINWRDLLTFSFNYNIVGPSGSCSTWPLLATNELPRQLNKTAQPVSVWLKQVSSNQPGGVTFALMLTNPGDAIHLFHSQISYNSNALSLMQVRRGEVGITQGSAEFFAHPNTGDGLVDVDLAALGPDAYVVGSGAVAYLDFSYKAAGIPSKIALKETILYDGEGNEIDLSPTDVEVENQGEAIPTEFALYYNHPNPFNPTTIIKYDLPQTSYVKLVVYNVMGQKVATLVDGVVEAGRHQMIWEAKDLSSGIYFYKITAGNFTQMHKMILLK